METDVLEAALREHWGLSTTTSMALPGGMNSQTWLIVSGERRYVAKHVTLPRLADLVAGCATAEAVSRAGVATGSPVRTTAGSLVAREPRLALLEHVPGRELDGSTEAEQRRMGRTLATVHAAGEPAHDLPDSAFFELLDATGADVGRYPWLTGVVDAALAEASALALTWSVLHTDPAPEAFLYDEATGTTGLIDWAGARRGPVLYDVASAVMYLGGPDRAAHFLAAYAAAGPLAADELRHLDVFRRFRWAVQAAYFAGRLAANDLTGITGRRDNERGLDDARRGLAALLPKNVVKVDDILDQ